MAALETYAAGQPGARPRVLVLEWSDPPMSGGHWTPDLVARAGGECVLGNPGANSTVLTWEAIAAADPSVVIVAPCGYGLEATLAAATELEAQPVWRTLRAVREGRAYALDGNAYVNRPGPRLVDTAELFTSILFGTPYGAACEDPQAYRALRAAPAVTRA
jgi:iron complex transport system substrate-binding protein